MEEIGVIVPKPTVLPSASNDKHLDKMDSSDLYTLYKKLQQQLEFLEVQEEYIKVRILI